MRGKGGFRTKSAVSVFFLIDFVTPKPVVWLFWGKLLEKGYRELRQCVKDYEDNEATVQSKGT